MFRLQDNVPEVYVEKSRDFQLFCRLFDACFGATKYSVDSITKLVDSARVNNSMLAPLQTKVGFFSDLDISEDKLRIIIDAFPYIIRNKNSQRGLDYVQALIKRLSKDATIVLEFAKEENSSNSDADKSVLVVSSSTKNVDFELIDELLRFVLPSGYNVTYQIANTQTPTNVDYVLKENVSIKTDYDDNLSRVSSVQHVASSKSAIYDINRGVVGLTKVYDPRKTDQDEDKNDK